MADNISSSSCVAEQHNAEGSQAFKAADYNAAYRCYSKAIKADPTAPKYWTNRANTLFRLGRTRQVIDDADAATKADPTWMKAYYFRALAHEKLGNLDQAIQALRQAAALDPGSEGVTAALNRCLEAKDEARRKETAASSRSFCNDPARSEATFQRVAQGLRGRPPSRQQMQQAQNWNAAHSLVIKADKLRFGSPPDLTAAAALYKQAAERGSASGQFNYAQMIQHRAVREPLAAAMPWLLKAAAQQPVLAFMPGAPNVGVVEAWVMLGDMYRDGLTGKAPDYAEAMRWYLKAAEAPNEGSALAQNNIGRAYAAGEGVQQDAAVAASWYKKAADQGYGVAEFNLAALLRVGAGVPQDRAAALDLARRAEQHGVAEAAGLQVDLEPSCAVAAAKLRALAEAGDPVGCFQLAQAYHQGWHGCEKDLQAANKWLLAAAAGRLPEAQLLLGRAYKTGQWGCEVLPLKAVSNLEKAAHQGLAEAQLEAARCHMMGVGTKVDFSKARQWAAKAAEQGNQEAADLLHSLDSDKGGSRQWSRTMEQIRKGVPQGATGAEAAGAMLESLMSSATGGGIPQEVKDCMREMHQLLEHDAANPVSAFSASKRHSEGPGGKFPMEQLLQYRSSAVVQPYIQAKLCLAAGLELCLVKGQQELGYQTLARGYALCHRVMSLPAPLIDGLERHLLANPNDASTALVHTMGTAAMRGNAWAEQRLGQLLPGLPEELRPHVQLLRAELRMWPQLSDYAGAIADTKVVLQLLPSNADALYVCAVAMQFLAQRTPSTQRRGGRRPAAGTYTPSQVEAALREFLAAAPPEHNKRPHGFYTLAFHLLSAGKGSPSGAAGSVEEAAALYQAGLAAEADLPAFFLPVDCGVKKVLAPMLTMLRATAGSSTAAAAAAAAASKRGNAGADSSSSSRSMGGTDKGGSSCSSGSKGSCCDRCGADAVKLMKCGKCKQRCYCSKQCQLEDWKQGHARVCGK